MNIVMSSHNEVQTWDGQSFWPEILHFWWWDQLGKSNLWVIMGNSTFESCPLHSQSINLNRFREAEA